MCLFPTRAQSQEFGRPKLHPEGDIVLPCGRCTECISKRAIEWATRAKHEISMHTLNCFITLTYDDQHLPPIHDTKPEFQKFIKRLRKKTKTDIRYMVSHEYGSKTYRPHHHAIIFGWAPDNQHSPRPTPSSGELIFRSPELESLWQLGFSSVGSATERSAYYIASYSLKGKKHTYTDPHTGELITISDCMDASKRPAIGYTYFVQNQKQLVQSNQILPRYYLKRLLLENPTLHQQYENDRSLNLKTRSSHELYSKFILDTSKDIDSEFRTSNSTFQSHDQDKHQLLSNRDEYHRLTKKE
nr:MAG: replication initiator protein [Microvirus sp.]